MEELFCAMLESENFQIVDALNIFEFLCESYNKNCLNWEHELVYDLNQENWGVFFLDFEG